MSFNEELIDLLVKYNKDCEINIPSSILAEHIENYLNILTTTLSKFDDCCNKTTISVEEHKNIIDILDDLPEPSVMLNYNVI